MLQYQQRTMAAQGFTPLPRYTATYTLGESLKTIFDSTHPMKPGEFRMYGAYRGAAGQAFSERMAQSFGAIAEVGASTAMTEGLALAGFATLGIAGGMVLPMAGGLAYDAFKRYTGFNQAVSQFSRINDIQIASNDFSSGVYSRDPMGRRMQRSDAKKVNDFLEDYARVVSTHSAQSVSSDELRSEVAKFSDAKLLENVRGAEDFARRFTSLKEAVIKVTSTLGKSFDEGVEVLAKMRQLNINPHNASAVLDSVRRMGTQAGLDFDTTFASGMQGALLGRQFRVSAEGGALIGAKAAADASILYQTGALSSDLLFRMGGEEGVRQSMIQNMLTASRSSSVDLSLLSAFRNGSFDKARFMDFASGKASILNDFRFDGGVEDLIAFNAKRGSIVSELNEQNPLLIQTAMFRQLFETTTKALGRFEDENVLLQAMSEFSGGEVGKDDLKVMLEQIRSFGTGLERADRENRMIGLGRAQQLSERGVFGSIAHWMRGTNTYGLLADSGMSITDSVRSAFYDASEGFNRHMRNLTTGVYDPGQGSYGAQIRDVNGNPIQEGFSSVFNESLLNNADGSDMLMEMSAHMGLTSSRVKMPMRDTLGPRSQEWWRSRLAEMSGLNLGLSEDAFDKYASREVSVNDFARENNLVLYSNKDGSVYVSRRDEIEGMLDSSAQRASSFRAAREIDPLEIKATATRSLNVSKMIADFKRRVPQRAARLINNDPTTAGTKTAALIDQTIEAIDPNASEEEKTNYRALLLHSLQASMPELGLGFSGVGNNIDLGIAIIDMKEAESMLEIGQEKFLNAFMDKDEILSVTRGGSFSGLSGLKRAAFIKNKINSNDTARANDRLREVRDYLKDGGYNDLVSIYNAYDNLVKNGATPGEAQSKLFDNAELLPLLNSLSSIGISHEDAIEMMEKSADLRQITTPVSDKLRSVVLRNEDRIAMLYKNSLTYAGTPEQYAKLHHADLAFKGQPVQEVFDAYNMLRRTKDELAMDSQIKALAMIQSGTGEKQGEAVVMEPNTAAEKTNNSIMLSIMQSMASDISTMTRESVRASNAVVSKFAQ